MGGEQLGFPTGGLDFAVAAAERSFHDRRGCRLPIPWDLNRCSQVRASILTGERFFRANRTDQRTTRSRWKAGSRNEGDRNAQFKFARIVIGVVTGVTLPA